MKTKNYLLNVILILVITFSLTMFSVCGEGDGEIEDTEEYLDCETGPDTFGCEAPEDPEQLADDGSWVAIIEGQVYSAANFERDFELYLTINLPPDQQALIRENLEQKKNVFNELMLIRLVFREALANSEQFQGEEGQKIMRLFSWMALVQYYIFKNVEQTVRSYPVTREDLRRLYEENKEYYQSNNIESFDAAINDPQVKSVMVNQFRTFKSRVESGHMVEDLISRNRIVHNEEVEEAYISGEITKEDLQEGDPEQYWIFKINDAPYYLKNLVEFMEVIKNMQMSQETQRLLDLPAEINPFNQEETPEMRDELLKQYYQMELIYRQAHADGLHQTEEGKRFVNLVIASMAGQYYMQQQIIERIEDPTEEEINSVLEEQRERLLEALTQYNMEATDQNLHWAARQALIQKRLQEEKEKYQVRLLERFVIIKSKTYFQSASDRELEQLQQQEGTQQTATDTTQDDTNE